MKCTVEFTSSFKKQYKKLKRQRKNLNKLFRVIEALANKVELEEKHKDHALLDNKYYKNCRECHIEPDWLLIYKFNEEKLILLLLATGSHSELFR